MNVREYQASDLPQLMELGNRAWQSIRQGTRAALGEDLYALVSPGAETAKGLQIKRHVEAHPQWIRVCVDDAARIVGFITFRMNCGRGVGEILNNAVDPACGIKGAGQMMYATVLQIFREQGLKVAKVDTGLDDAHGPARRAYQRAGFVRNLEHVTYYMPL